jgi:hypothetical protein
VQKRLLLHQPPHLRDILAHPDHPHDRASHAPPVPPHSQPRCSTQPRPADRCSSHGIVKNTNARRYDQPFDFPFLFD